MFALSFGKSTSTYICFSLQNQLDTVGQSDIVGFVQYPTHRITFTRNYTNQFSVIFLVLVKFDL